MCTRPIHTRGGIQFLRVLRPYRDLPHGAENISVPIYTIKGTNIVVPISLNYNTSGIRVNEYSSAIGLGWNLSAGGSLGRSLGSRFGGYTEAEKDTIIVRTSENFMTTGHIPAEEYEDHPLFPHSYYRNTWDIQPHDIDLFYYSIPNHSGRFFVDQNNKVHTIPYNPKIIIDLENYKITDENGIIYSFSFSHKERTTSSGSRWTSLKIDRISDPHTGEWVSFKYSEETIQNYQFYVAMNYHWANCDNDYYAPYTFDHRLVDNFYPAIQYRISEINTSWETKVNFLADNVERVDLDGSFAINEIKVSNPNSSLEKRFKLYQSYFSCEGAGDFYSYSGSSSRENIGYTSCLRLDSIKEISDSHEENPFEFKYHDKPAIRGTLSQDRFGFYNGANNDRLLHEINVHCQITGANRQPNLSFCQRGALKEYTLPTKGKFVYYYGLNKYTKDSQVLDGAGLRIDKKEYVDPSGSKHTTKYVYENGLLSNEPRYDPLTITIYDTEPLDGYALVWRLKETQYHLLAKENGTNAFCHGVTPLSAYEKVTELNVDDLNQTNGKISYYYENVGSGSLLRFSYLGDNTPRLRKKEIYSGSSQYTLLSEEEYFYSKDYFATGYGHEITQTEILKGGLWTGKSSFENYYQVKAYVSSINRLDSLVSKNIYTNGEVRVVTSYKYDDYYFVKETETEVNGKNLKTISQRAYQYSSANPTINSMIAMNYISPVIETVKIVDDMVNEGVFNLYKVENNMVILSETHLLESTPLLTAFNFSSANGSAFVKDNNYQLEESFTWYNGKLYEKVSKDGSTISYIWNQINNNMPLVIGRNISASELYPVFGNSLAQLGIQNLGTFLSYDVHNLDTQVKRDKWKELNLKINALVKKDQQITTIYSQPLIGVMGQTDANGNTNFYRYDEFGRLISILNDDFDVIESYKYNYRK